MAKRNYDVLLKILLIGDSGVGKTSILQRFCNDNYNDSFISTIGIDFKVKTIDLAGKIVKLQIWDTAGQERFHTITASYYRGANAIILIYDGTNLKSFENISKWIERIDEHAPSNIVKMILCNKVDMIYKIQVSNEQGAEVASRLKVPFFSTSARNGTNVSKAFHCIAENALERYLSYEYNGSIDSTVRISNNNEHTKRHGGLGSVSCLTERMIDWGIFLWLCVIF